MPMKKGAGSRGAGGSKPGKASDLRAPPDRRRRQPTGRVTISDLARLLDVSVMTVSRALNTPEKVSETLRRRVLDAARELGYVRNNLAGGLASARTGIVAVLVPSLSNAVFDAMLLGLSETVEACGYNLLTANTFYSLEREMEIVNNLLGWRPDGLILSGVDHHPDLSERLRSVGVPVIEVMDMTATPIDTVVGFSHDDAARRMIGHMMTSGYRTIAFVGAQFDRDFRTRRRLDGYMRAHAEAGREAGPQIVYRDKSSYELGAHAISVILDQHPGIDAVFMTNDDMAAGAVMYCLGKGVDVPGRIAIAGFNALEAGQSLHPRLTTVETPRYLVGTTAGRILLEKFRGKETDRRIDLGCRLKVGETT